MKLSLPKKAIIALIVANMIWGAAPPVFKWSLEQAPLFTIAFLRFIIPALLIFAAADKKQLKIKRTDFRTVFYIGYSLITVNILFFFLGVQRTVSVNASAISAASPIFLTLGSLFFLREKVSKKVFLGNIIGFLGVFIIIFQPFFHDQVDGNFLGNIFLTISALGVIIGTILAKEVIKSYHPITLTFWAFVIGALTFFPMFLVEILQIGFLTHINLQVIVGILFGSFLSSLTAYFLYFWSLKYLPASQVGVFTYIDPVTNIIIAIPLLHESLQPIYITGSLLIFFGIYIAERRIHYHPLHKLFNS